MSYIPNICFIIVLCILQSFLVNSIVWNICQKTSLDGNWKLSCEKPLVFQQGSNNNDKQLSRLSWRETLANRVDVTNENEFPSPRFVILGQAFPIISKFKISYSLILHLIFHWQCSNNFDAICRQVSMDIECIEVPYIFISSFFFNI